jgi:hypothetical protein
MVSFEVLNLLFIEKEISWLNQNLSSRKSFMGDVMR